MNLDRPNRDRLADAIRRFLAEEITAFQFDDEIHEIAIASDDSTVKHVVCHLWFFYDDCKDHTVVLSKEQWDYLYRLVLLLNSNGHIEVTTRRRWSVFQFGAAMCLGLFGLSVLWLGIGWHLLIVTVPFGVASMLLAACHSRFSPEPSAHELTLHPFASTSQILAVRRSVVGFSKRPYPRHLKTKRIRSPLMAGATMIPSWIFWLVLSPLVLLIQALPDIDADTRVHVSA